MDRFARSRYKERMNAQIHGHIPHRSWYLPPKNRAVDKVGIAVALLFLIAITLIVGGRGDKASDHTARTTQLIASPQAESRPEAEASRELAARQPSSGHAQSPPATTR